MLTAPRNDYPSGTYLILPGKGLESAASFAEAVDAAFAQIIREDLWRVIERATSTTQVEAALFELTGQTPIGVASFDDFDLGRALRLVTRLQWPTPAFAPAALAAFDKIALYARLRDAGLPIPAFHIVDAPSTLPDLLRTLDWPSGGWIAKPARGTGSGGVLRLTRADNVGDAAEAIWRATGSERGPFVLMASLDTRVDGVAELCADGLILDGEVRTIVVSDKARQDGRRKFQDRLIVSPPSSTAVRALTTAIESCAHRVLQALSCETTVFHIEFRLSEAGEPVPIDVALRPGGGFIPELVRHRTGLDLRLAHANLWLGRIKAVQALAGETFTPRRAAAIGVAYNAPAARPTLHDLARILSAANSEPALLAHHAVAELSTNTHATPDIGMSLAFAAETPDEAIALFDRFAVTHRLE